MSYGLITNIAIFQHVGFILILTGSDCAINSHLLILLIQQNLKICKEEEEEEEVMESMEVEVEAEVEAIALGKEKTKVEVNMEDKVKEVKDNMVISSLATNNNTIKAINLEEIGIRFLETKLIKLLADMTRMGQAILKKNNFKHFSESYANCSICLIQIAKQIDTNYDGRINKQQLFAVFKKVTNY